ncbi:hypothetical protein ScalyP_jg7114 [Parmales sp. scaly parma]|nr:hypothetical protein ScalyP_jg7114 [Parmales sp. scaly parma]
MDPLHHLSVCIDNHRNNPPPHLVEAPSPLTFCRDFVAKNSPCTFANVGEHSVQFSETIRSLPALEELLKNEIVTVNVTPSKQQADAIQSYNNEEKMFLKPHEQKMKFGTFIERLKSGDPLDDVFYLSAQNDNLRRELPALISHIPSSLPLGEKVFNSTLDAINLWIGNGKSTSSTHHDFYENLYYVAVGQKIFTVYPPSDFPFLNEVEIKSGTFANDENNWEVDLDAQKVKWLDVEGQSETDRARCHAKRIVVNAGEFFYLPALWFHQVENSKSPEHSVSVAVNYWYDLDFSLQTFAFYEFTRSVAEEYKQKNNNKKF